MEFDFTDTLIFVEFSSLIICLKICALQFSAAGLFAAVYLATFLISNVVTNNAAAALIFPIAMNAAEQTDTDVVLMSYCVMLGASASFMSPFGYT